MNKLDELFKERLADFGPPPPPGSWERVETRLSKKNNGLLWWRRAAAWLLGGLLLGTLWLQLKEPARPIAQKDPVVPQKQQGAEVKTPEPARVADNRVTGNTTRRKSSSSPIQRKPTTQAIPLEQPQVVAVENDAPIADTPTPAVVKTRPSIVLTYTLDPVEAPVSIREAAEETEEPEEAVARIDMKDKSLKRVMKFAGNVKNSDSPLGGLREIKDDLMALDIRKKTATKKQ